MIKMSIESPFMSMKTVTHTHIHTHTYTHTHTHTHTMDVIDITDSIRHTVNKE